MRPVFPGRQAANEALFREEDFGANHRQIAEMRRTRQRIVFGLQPGLGADMPAQRARKATLVGLPAGDRGTMFAVAQVFCKKTHKSPAEGLAAKKVMAIVLPAFSRLNWEMYRFIQFPDERDR